MNQCLIAVSLSWSAKAIALTFSQFLCILPIMIRNSHTIKQLTEFAWTFCVNVAAVFGFWNCWSFFYFYVNVLPKSFLSPEHLPGCQLKYFQRYCTVATCYGNTAHAICLFAPHHTTTWTWVAKANVAQQWSVLLSSLSCRVVHCSSSSSSIRRRVHAKQVKLALCNAHNATNFGHNCAYLRAFVCTVWIVIHTATVGK